MKMNRLLTYSLRANATFSALSGAALLLAPDRIAGMLGTAGQELLLQVVGLNLLGFAAGLVWISLRPVVQPLLIRVVIGLDLAWVAGSALLAPLDPFSTAGWILVGVVALIVLDFALLQYAGLRGSLRTSEAT